MVTLPEGAVIYHLADMGDWSYIESISGDDVRGFVKHDLIRLGTVYDLKNYPSNDGTQILSGTIIIEQNNVEVEIEPCLFDNDRRITVSGFNIYDNIAGDLLLTINTTNTSGKFVSTGELLAGKTLYFFSVLLTGCGSVLPCCIYLPFKNYSPFITCFLAA